MKNMLVTGGCGFIGSNFIRYLLEESEFRGRVVNVDKLTYAGNLENLGMSRNASFWCSFSVSPCLRVNFPKVWE